MNPLAIRDALRLAESAYSGNLWRRQRDGEKIFKSDYDPLERIKHYDERNIRYGEYLAKHIAGGDTLTDIMNVINGILAFIPKEIKDEVIRFVTEFLKGLIFGKGK
jgi:hypothetical protein